MSADRYHSASEHIMNAIADIQAAMRNLDEADMGYHVTWGGHQAILDALYEAQEMVNWMT